eukprot:TRINITY_DN105455_c0_g1_i1.p1 TRINITY_DN105455_c0_g1~~TRINITY_DN105455_c0_g1_i1.p1  ORF type:complete len:615 (-),score=92.80 TRINITY_DN105455_c0_g1_i1:182-1981(-)
MEPFEVDLMEPQKLLIDLVFKLVAGWLVFFMHAGWAMLETGAIRYGSIPGVLTKNLSTVCVGFLCWWMLGYSFAYNVASGGFMGGFGSAFRTDTPAWFWQGVFCTTAATIPSGAVAERMNMKFYALYAAAVSLFIFPVVSYWSSSGQGFLRFSEAGEGQFRSFVGSPFLDFAGAGAVHIVGGIGALVGAKSVGPREQRFENPDMYEPHNIALVVLATLLMWFSWFAFNAGSMHSLSEAEGVETVLRVVANTILAPAAAGLVSWGLHIFILQADSTKGVSKFCNGILAGAVAITSGCADVEDWAAVLIGIIAAAVYNASSKFLVMCQIDDPLDAFSVHGACGIWSLISTGFLCRKNGIFFGGDQLLVQVIGMAAIVLWCFLANLVVFLAFRRSKGFIGTAMQPVVEIYGAGGLAEPYEEIVVAPRKRSKENAPDAQDENNENDQVLNWPMPTLFEDEQSRQQRLDLLFDKVADMARLLGMRYTEDGGITSGLWTRLDKRIKALEQMQRELIVYKNGVVTWKRSTSRGGSGIGSGGGSQISREYVPELLRDLPPVSRSPIASEGDHDLFRRELPSLASASSSDSRTHNSKDHANEEISVMV